MNEIDKVELLRLGFESFGQEGPGVLPALLRELADPEIQLHAGPGIEPAGSYPGHEAVGRWSEEWFEAWEEYRVEPSEFIEVTDEIVVVPVHQVARGEGSGVEVEGDSAYLFEIREGRVTRFHIYMDTGQALSAAASLARES